LYWAGSEEMRSAQYFSASDRAAVRLPLATSEQTFAASLFAAEPKAVGKCATADWQAAAAAFNSDGVGVADAVDVPDGAVDAGLGVAGPVFAGAVFLCVLDALLFEDPPQPATSAALARATSNGEYTFRVIFPPLGVRLIGRARAAVGNLDDRPRPAQDSGQIGRSGRGARIERLGNEYTHALPVPILLKQHAVRLLKRGGVMPIFNG
jgi:hypothetical protein